MSESADYIAFLDVLPIRTGTPLLTRTYSRSAKGALPSDF